MHLIEIILLIAGGVCGGLETFEVPSKFSWAGVGLMFVALGAGLYIGHVH